MKYESLRELRPRCSEQLNLILGVAFFSLLLLNAGSTRCETTNSANQTNALSPNAAKLSAIVLPMGGLNAASTNYMINMTIGEAVVGNATGGGKKLALGYQSLIVTAVGACGDLDANGKIDITDIVYLINYLFASGPAPKDKNRGNVNCDDKTNITDAVYMVNYIFADGPVPCAACP